MNLLQKKTSSEVNKPDEKGIKLSEDELKKFEGKYEFAPGNEMEVYIKDGELKAFLEGQPEYTLVPLGDNEFSLQGMQGFKMVFELNGDQVSSVISSQPNGEFKAVKK